MRRAAFARVILVSIDRNRTQLIMDDTALRILLLLADSLLPISVGYFLSRRGLVSRATTQKLITFNVRVMFTILAFISFWKLRMTAELLWIPLIALVITFAPYFAGMAMSRGFAKPAERGAFVVSAMLGNTGTLGGLVSYLILGPIAYAYVQVVAVVQNFLIIVFCFPVCQRFHDLANTDGSAVKKRTFAELFFTWNQISLIGMIAGGALSAFSVPQPPLFDAVFSAFIHISCWINFLPVGLLLNFEAASKFMRQVTGIIPLKFVFVPAVTWAVSELLVSDPTIIRTMVILAATPTAINAVVSCALYRLETDLTMASFIGTTILFAAVLCPVFFVLWA